MLAHIGHRGRNHAGVMLHMLREYALAYDVADMCLGQGICENAETTDFFVKLGFHVDEVKTIRDLRILMEEKIDTAFFGVRLPEGRSFMRARLELGTCSSWNAALRE